MQYSRLFVALLATGTITACGGGVAHQPQLLLHSLHQIQLLVLPLPVQYSSALCWNHFTAPASTVTDNVDSGLTATVTGTVGNAPGQYTLTYITRYRR